MELCVGLIVVLDNYNRNSKLYSWLLELDYVILVLILSDKTLLSVRKNIEPSKCRNVHKKIMVAQRVINQFFPNNNKMEPNKQDWAWLTMTFRN